jgi:hypothetical protein
MNHTTGPSPLGAVVDGLRAVAGFLDAHPDLPMPTPRSEVKVYQDGTGDAKAERIAGCLGSVPVGRLGFYGTARNFGPVVYQAVVIPQSDCAATDALMSYSTTIRPREA